MSFLQVKRALSLWADGRVTIDAIRTAIAEAKGRTKITIHFAPVINESTGVASTTYAAFSQLRWKDDTARFVASAVNLTEEALDTIIEKAQAFVKVSNRGKDSESAPPNHEEYSILQPVEVSDDEAEDNWMPKLCKSPTSNFVDGSDKSLIAFTTVLAQPSRNPHNSANEEPATSVRHPALPPHGPGVHSMPASSYNGSAEPRSVVPVSFPNRNAPRRLIRPTFGLDHPPPHFYNPQQNEPVSQNTVTQRPSGSSYQNPTYPTFQRDGMQPNGPNLHHGFAPGVSARRREGHEEPYSKPSQYDVYQNSPGEMAIHCRVKPSFNLYNAADYKSQYQPHFYEWNEDSPSRPLLPMPHRSQGGVR